MPPFGGHRHTVTVSDANGAADGLFGAVAHPVERLHPLRSARLCSRVFTASAGAQTRKSADLNANPALSADQTDSAPARSRRDTDVCGQTAHTARQARKIFGMDNAVRTTIERIRARVSEVGGAEPGTAERLARDEIRRRVERALGGLDTPISDERAFERDVLARISGFGPFQALMDDPTIEEIWANGPNDVFVASAGRTRRSDVTMSEQELRDAVERMLQPTGRRLDTSTPFVDASLPDGSRLHVVIRDIVRESLVINIRKFGAATRDMRGLVQAGALPSDLADALVRRASAGANIIVSGATQAGKTTLLRALLEAVADGERIITTEETFELAIAGPDVVAMQCRQANLEGTGEVPLRRLVTEALRMRPDRLVIGEVRGAEALELLIALNSGVPGMCTVHANSASDALDKLALLPLLAASNIDGRFVEQTIARTINLVIHCAPAPHRGVAEVIEVRAEGNARRVHRLYERAEGAS